MNFTIVGTGYVGLSLSVLISQFHNVVAYDIDQEKIKQINKKKSPIKDDDIKFYLKNRNLNLTATNDKNKAYKSADYVIIATPTNYNITSKSFDTSSIEKVIRDLKKTNNKANIIIKSTIPFGYTNYLRKKFNNKNIFFSPEFLRENKALYDNLYPSRIIIGGKSKAAKKFANILKKCSKYRENQVQILLMSSKEAESVKLFSNTYLAMRIAFFNELDSFSEINNLNSKNIISGVSKDQRIGDYYNNPSFGYGGYCLPKDTRQLLDNYKNIPNNIIKAVVDSNSTRKKFIAKNIIDLKIKCLGIYRLTMKKDSDNFRESAVVDILDILKRKKIKLLIYEPLVTNKMFNGIKVINNFREFIYSADLIIANRLTRQLAPFGKKVYSRDLFKAN